MESKSFIVENLRNLFVSHSYLEIRYEYRANLATHIIEVKPLHCYDKDKSYILKQIALEDEFEQLFPHEEILFMTENVLIQIENPILELGTSLHKQTLYDNTENNGYIKHESITFDLSDLFGLMAKVNVTDAQYYYVNCPQNDLPNANFSSLMANNYYGHQPPIEHDNKKSKKNKTKKDSEIKQSLFFY